MTPQDREKYGKIALAAFGEAAQFNAPWDGISPKDKEIFRAMAEAVAQVVADEIWEAYPKMIDKNGSLWERGSIKSN
jgi:hypothetical protein